MPRILRLLAALLPLVLLLAVAGSAAARGTTAPVKVSRSDAAGTIVWKAHVSGQARVSFSVDGRALGTDTKAPYNFRLDTSRLATGAHRLKVQAKARGKRPVTSTVPFTVTNPTQGSSSGASNGSGGSSGQAGSNGKSSGKEKATKEKTESKESAPPVSPPVVSPPVEPSGHELVVEPTSTGPIAAPNSIYWGAWIGNQLTGEQAPWDMSAVSKFESLANKPVSLISFAAPFANCPTGSSQCSFYNFPVNEMNTIRAHGAIPFYSWSSQSIPSTRTEPNFQLSDVIAGTYDSYIRKFAEAAKAWGHPFFLRFDWEMNGGWFPWSEGVNGNNPGEYVAAWRHVHDIFTQVGAENVSWVWCANIDPTHDFQNLKSLYPGDEYVDWTSLDGYNWGTNPAKPDRWLSFDQLYSSTYNTITKEVAPTKPMVIGEIGSTEYGGSKAAWIEEALSAIPNRYQKIRAMVWFEQFDDGMDWPIETSSASASAFARGISNSAYAGNTFGALPAGRIAPAN
jgi:hypothetical protein